MNKIQHKFWVTKQAVARKLGKDEDEHIVSSDSELDAKLTLFRSIDDTTRALQMIIEHYQDRVCNLSYEENAMGRFLKEYGKADRTKAGKMMVAVGKTMSYSGQQRLAIRVPLVRLYQEVETFKQRAIEDTIVTLKRMEKSRTEYRGALMWMKNVSQELDPDTYKQLEKFRKVQGHVKKSKAMFDKYKLDCLQKVDLLAASRCNMFSHALIMYQNALILFWEKTAKTMNHVHDSFQGYQDYEFTYIKELIDPNKDVDDDRTQSKRRSKKAEQPQPGRQEGNDQGTGDLSENQRDLLGISAPSGQYGEQFEQGGMSDALLDFGFEDEESDANETAAALVDLPTLTPSGPLRGPTDTEDAKLLEELMGENEADLEGSTGFSAQWNEMFGAQEASDIVSEANQRTTSDDDEFSQFISARSENLANQKDLDLLMPMGPEDSKDSNLLPLPSGSKSASASSSFLPSQLFDLDQSLFSSQRKEHDLLQDFPMPSPARPASVQRKIKASDAKKKVAGGSSEMSQWFNLFADLDPLSNPDAIGKTTKEEDKNCYS